LDKQLEERGCMFLLRADQPCNPQEASHTELTDLDFGSQDDYRCMMEDDGKEEGGSAPRLDDLLAVLDDAPMSTRSWTGTPTCREWARHRILKWRLKRPYLLYCLCCSAATLGLLAWNLTKGMQHNWDLPQWKHNRWEEVLEVMLGAGMVIETLLTLWVLGVRDFFRSCWCIFDFVVMLITVLSITWGLIHIGRMGEIAEADVPLLCLRFVAQPLRVMAVCMSASRTHEMQQVDELQVNFADLSPANGSIMMIDA